MIPISDKETGNVTSNVSATETEDIRAQQIKIQNLAKQTNEAYQHQNLAMLNKNKLGVVSDYKTNGALRLKYKDLRADILDLQTQLKDVLQEVLLVNQVTYDIICTILFR